MILRYRIGERFKQSLFLFTVAISVFFASGLSYIVPKVSAQTSTTFPSCNYDNTTFPSDWMTQIYNDALNQGHTYDMDNVLVAVEDSGYFGHPSVIVAPKDGTTFTHEWFSSPSVMRIQIQTTDWYSIYYASDANTMTYYSGSQGDGTGTYTPLSPTSCYDDNTNVFPGQSAENDNGLGASVIQSVSHNFPLSSGGYTSLTPQTETQYGLPNCTTDPITSFEAENGKPNLYDAIHYWQQQNPISGDNATDDFTDSTQYIEFATYADDYNGIGYDGAQLPPNPFDEWRYFAYPSNGGTMKLGLDTGFPFIQSTTPIKIVKVQGVPEGTTLSGSYDANGNLQTLTMPKPGAFSVRAYDYSGQDTGAHQGDKTYWDLSLGYPDDAYCIGIVHNATYDDSYTFAHTADSNPPTATIDDSCSLLDIGCDIKKVGDAIGTALSDGLKAMVAGFQWLMNQLFVPPTDQWNAEVSDFSDWWHVKFGLVAYSISAITDLFNGLATASTGTTFSFGQYFGGNLNVDFSVFEQHWSSLWTLMTTLLRASVLIGLLLAMRKRVIGIMAK